MADQNVTQLTEITSPALTDLLYVGADPAGTPADRKATIASVLKLIYPVGSVYINASDATNPGTLLGFGTWEAFGAGRVMVGLDSEDGDFDTAEETGGAKTVAAEGTVSQPTFTGDAISDVINHTHPVVVDDPQHAHVENSNNSTTGGLRGWGAADTSTNTSTATGYSTAPAATGITATTSNPAGGVASITPTGTVSQPTFTGSATSVVQPYITVYCWKRTE